LPALDGDDAGKGDNKQSDKNISFHKEQYIKSMPGFGNRPDIKKAVKSFVGFTALVMYVVFN
jgi:hypothetical protein